MGVDTAHTLTEAELIESAIQFCERKKAKGTPNRLLNVKRTGQPTKVRRYHVMNQITPVSGLGVYNNTVSTVMRALMERYFMVKTPSGFRRPLKPGKGAFKTKLLNQFKRIVVESTKASATRLSDAEVVALYSGAKRKLYQNAMISLARQRVHSKDAWLRPFPKFEKQDLTKAPRIINPRNPRYNLELARFLKHMEKAIYKSINKAWGRHTDHTVIKGLNCFDAAKVIRKKWQRFKRPVAVGLDATKWDAHVSLLALIYEHEFYLELYDNHPKLKQLLEWQLNNIGIAYCDDGTVEFVMQGTRASGDINTSLGNCILACALVWEYCAEMGIDAELCNNGDDCVVIMEMEDLDVFMQHVEGYYAKRGFRIEVETPVYEFEQIEFCQTHPVYDGEDWRMMRNPLACMKKDGMCLMPVSNQKAFAKWLWAVGQCGLSAASGLPVLQSWYSMFERAGRRCSNRFIKHLFNHSIYLDSILGLAPRVRPVTDAARASFYTATGLTPDMQLAYESYFDSVTLESSLGTESLAMYTCETIPIISLASDIFDNTHNLNPYRKYATEEPTDSGEDTEDSSEEEEDSNSCPGTGTNTTGTRIARTGRVGW